MVDTVKEDQQQSLKQKWLVLRKKTFTMGLILFYKIFSQ